MAGVWMVRKKVFDVLNVAACLSERQSKGGQLRERGRTAVIRVGVNILDQSSDKCILPGLWYDALCTSRCTGNYCADCDPRKKCSTN